MGVIKSVSFLLNPYLFAAPANTAIPTTNLLFEHRATDVSGADDTRLSAWPDHYVPTSHNLSAAGGGYIFNNILNGHPIVRFKGLDAFNLTTGVNPSAYTYAAVMKFTGGSGAQTLLSGVSGSIQIRINSNKLNLLKNATANIASNTTTLSGSTFYTVAVTYDGTNYAFYLNGAADGSGSNSQSFSGTASVVGRRGQGDESFTGDLAHHALYSAVLNSTDLTALFDAMRNLWAHY